MGAVLIKAAAILIIVFIVSPPPPTCPLYLIMDHRRGEGGLLTTTKYPAPPAAPTPILPPSLNLAPSAHLKSTVAFSEMVPGRLGSLLSSSNSDYCSRCFCSRSISCLNSCVRCDSTRPPPAPRDRLTLTVTFSMMVPGRLGLGQAYCIQAEFVEV